MRLMKGLDMTLMQQKFPENVTKKIESILHNLQERGWVNLKGKNWALSKEGLVLSNQVFQELTFLENEFPQGPNS
jgi:oxygen-independent coproporphyrinogen-3 oxidase